VSRIRDFHINQRTYRQQLLQRTTAQDHCQAGYTSEKWNPALLDRPSAWARAAAAPNALTAAPLRHFAMATLLTTLAADLPALEISDPFATNAPSHRRARP
jgi:hypothetical protein